jgi:hypothetical protein
MKRYLVFVLGLLFLVGCAHGGKVSDVRPGMSVDELHTILGPHQGYKKDGEYEVYSYYNQFVSNLSSVRSNYHYIFINGKLDEYGAGELRMNPDTGRPYIMPIK